MRIIIDVPDWSEPEDTYDDSRVRTAEELRLIASALRTSAFLYQHANEDDLFLAVARGLDEKAHHFDPLANAPHQTKKKEES